MSAPGALRREQQIAPPAGAQEVAGLQVNQMAVVLRDRFGAHLASLPRSRRHLLAGAGLADALQNGQRAARSLKRGSRRGTLSLAGSHVPAISAGHSAYTGLRPTVTGTPGPSVER